MSMPINKAMGLFSGAFSNFRFDVQEKKKHTETLPQMNVKPLDIMEPQILGKSSMTEKNSTNSLETATTKIKNDFQPTKILQKQQSDDKNFSETKFNNNNTGHEQAPKYSVGNERSKQLSDHLENVVDPIKYKSIFIGKNLPMSLFEVNSEEVKISWDIQSLSSSQPQIPPKQKSAPKPQISNINNSENLTKSENNIQTPSTPQPQNLTKSEPPKNKKKKPKTPKQPITIQSIFEKYRKLNKIVTKIVHKKNEDRTEKWVYFKDGSSVLEDPGYPSESEEEEEEEDQRQELEQETNELPKSADVPIPEPGVYDPNNNHSSSNRNIHPPSNVFMYDHQDLVAEFDPSNRRNIALTLYEITTLQQRHLFCKYFDPSPHPKFQTMISMIDFKQAAHPSIYHNIDLLDDYELLKPKSSKVQEPTHFWTKTLRKSNRGLISKKNKVIKK